MLIDNHELLYDLIRFCLKKIKFNFPQQINKTKIMNYNASTATTHTLQHITQHLMIITNLLCFHIFFCLNKNIVQCHYILSLM